MQLWALAAAVVVLALLIDRFIGDPPNSIHPLRWIGSLLDRIDRAVSDRGPKAVRWGVLAYVGTVAASVLAAVMLTASVRLLAGMTGIVLPLPGGYSVGLDTVAWTVVSAVLLKLSFSVFLFRRLCRPIQDGLRAGRLDEAAAELRMIVSRDTAGMDAAHIASSCCETITENLVDSAVSPALYGGILGLPGAVMFRLTNMMDAMWGYLDDRYASLGRAAARADDLLCWLPARLSPYIVAAAARLAGTGGRGAVAAAKAEHGKTPSPNSGYPMAACAAALGIAMEKRDVYVIGDGRPPDADDITRCCRLTEISSVLSMLLLMLPLYVLMGIHVQMSLEGAVVYLLRWLL